MKKSFKFFNSLLVLFVIVFSVASASAKEPIVSNRQIMEINNKLILKDILKECIFPIASILLCLSVERGFIIFENPPQAHNYRSIQYRHIEHKIHQLS